MSIKRIVAVLVVAWGILSMVRIALDIPSGTGLNLFLYDMALDIRIGAALILISVGVLGYPED